MGCKNVLSHMPGNNVNVEKKTEFLEFMEMAQSE